MNTATVRRYTPGEEIASSATHAVGAVLSILALVALTVPAARHGDTWQVVSFAIYGTTLVVMYLSSLLYHSIRKPGAKKVFRSMDHCSIFLLIAGTYTPFTLVSLRGGWGWTLFGLVWGAAALGILLTLLGAVSSRLMASLVYIAMGWMVVVAIRPLVESVAMGGIAWLVAGGVFYSAGVVFYVWKRLPFNHAIWHLFVLCGSACHFMAVWLYVLPETAG